MASRLRRLPQLESVSAPERSEFLRTARTCGCAQKLSSVSCVHALEVERWRAPELRRRRHRMATLSRQDSSDGRADQPEEVRDLRAMRGDSAVLLLAHLRALP